MNPLSQETNYKPGYFVVGALEIADLLTETQLNIIDIEQHEFFKTVYNKKATSYDEFDMVINRDHINEPFQAA